MANKPLQSIKFPGLNDVYTIPQIDPTLSQAGEAADALATGVRNTNLNNRIDNLSAAVPSEVKQALYTLLSKAAYTETGLVDELTVVESWAGEVAGITIDKSSINLNGSKTYQLVATTDPVGGAVTWTTSDADVATVSNTGLVTSIGNGTAIITAMCGRYKATCVATVTGFATITNITATYTQSGGVYATDTLDKLRTDLVVTAHYSDDTSRTVTAYSLSGTLAIGTSTITVDYHGNTTTFTVNVTEKGVLYNLSSPLVLDGTTVDDMIKTDVRLAANDINFSIMLEFTNNNTPNWRMLLHCMDDKTPYPGYSFAVTDTDRQYRFMDNRAEYWFPKTTKTTDVIRFAYTHAGNGGSCYAYMSVNGTTKDMTNYIARTITTTTNKPLGIGGTLDNKGNKGNVWKGTISVAKIFSRVCTTSEVNNFLQNGVVA